MARTPSGTSTRKDTRCRIGFLLWVGLLTRWAGPWRIVRGDCTFSSLHIRRSADQLALLTPLQTPAHNEEHHIIVRFPSNVIIKELTVAPPNGRSPAPLVVVDRPLRGAIDYLGRDFVYNGYSQQLSDTFSRPGRSRQRGKTFIWKLVHSLTTMADVADSDRFRRIFNVETESQSRPTCFQ
jgi:hypothetical protein